MANILDINQSLEAIKVYLQNLEKLGIISNLNITYNVGTPVVDETNISTVFDILLSTILNIKKESEKLIAVGNQCTTSLDNNINPKLVQICVSRKEINRRIDSFIRRKRKEVDDLNIQEFCGRTSIDEDNTDYENLNSCSRVDAVYFPHYGGKSHFKISRIENKWGPQTRPKSNVDGHANPLTNPFTKQLADDGIEERLRNMESHLKIKTEPETKNNIFARLKILEDKILLLEGISPDYFGSSMNKLISSKEKLSHEIESKYQDWSLSDIDSRMEQLSRLINDKNK